MRQKMVSLILCNPIRASKLSRFALLLLLVSYQVATTQQELGDFTSFTDCETTSFTALVSYLYNILTGGFGALIMIVSGIGAILAAAFGQYRAALSALVVALGVFVLQIFIAAFFGSNMFEDGCDFLSSG